MQDKTAAPVEPMATNWIFRWRRNARRVAPFLAGVLATLLGLFLYRTLIQPTPQLTEQDVQSVVAQAMASATPPPAYSAQVYQTIQPSLVLIETTGKDIHGQEGHGLGSGVIINDRAEILTSLHVVDNASSIQVAYFDGTTSPAHLVASQPENDIAVIVPDQPPALLAPATLGNPDAMNVGDEAFAVGNPFGLYSSLSAGVISGFERSFQPEGQPYELTGLIQIDAAVNPGNSGGPLLNRDGQVIGIVVGIVNPSRGEFFIGIGFAVPIQVAAQAAGSPQY